MKLARFFSSGLFALAGVWAMGSGSAWAAYTLIDVKGGGFKTGQQLEASDTVNLKEGERITVVGVNGKTITLRGPYSGPLSKEPEGATDRASALAALIANRDARTSTVGVIRAGNDSARLPSPWLVDVSFSSTKCIQPGNKPVWWRPDAAGADTLSVSPADRSWKADYVWPAGQAVLNPDQVLQLQAQNLMYVRTGQKEVGIQLLVLPAMIKDPIVQLGWMLEKGCVQQANAFLDELRDREQRQ